MPGGNACFDPYFAIGTGPPVVYVPVNRKKWSRVLAIGASAIVLLAAAGVVMYIPGHHTGKSFGLLGGNYYNVFTGKPVPESAKCNPGSFRRPTSDGFTECIDCPVGKVFWILGKDPF
jgi:hypothetical protein